MNTIPIYQVDAFTYGPFSGNPAAVCPLSEWLSEETMQLIAAENNLSETAFIVKEKNKYAIRWFTPKVEVDLCGHATLAAGHVLFTHLNVSGEEINLYSPISGDLRVLKQNTMLALDFPQRKLDRGVLPDDIATAVGGIVQECYERAGNYMLVYNSEADITKLTPDFKSLRKCDCRSVIATSPGTEVDFVSRFFAPKVGVTEDPVTGSSHTSLTPYWSERLNKVKLTARQLSKRGGYLECELNKDRVLIAGHSLTFMKGEIYLVEESVSVHL